MAAPKPSIPEFYAGKNIFLTGATGFLGKVLIEKLLRSCPKVKAIYCLARGKKDMTAQERLNQMFELKLYGKLRSEQPDFMEKVHAINGDMLEEELGIDPADVETLQNNIDIVFHSAATVRFDEHLRHAVQLNVLGLRKMIHLCKTFKNLQAFIHISTAYANCDQEYIEEIIYPMQNDPHKVINAVEWMDDEMVDLVTPKLIGDKPNTYTYTKHLAEKLLQEEASNLPVAICRPSIITAAWREPLPGWIDNIQGPSGLAIAAGKGLLRTMKGESHLVADIIPVDLPTNMLIAVAWNTVVNKPGNMQIYHMTSGGLNPFTWGEMENIVMDYFKQNPLDSCFRRPKFSFTKSSLVNDYWMFVSHLIPAYLADIGYRLLGKKPRMVQIYQRIHKAMGELEFFAGHSWDWTHSNMDALKSQMSPADQKVFFFDPRALHWPTYIQNYCMGAKTFVLKEDLSGLPAARAHLRKLRNIRYMFNAVLVVVFWRLLIARSSLARNSWFFVMGLVFKFVRFFRLTSTLSR